MSFEHYRAEWTFVDSDQHPCYGCGQVWPCDASIALAERDQHAAQLEHWRAEYEDALRVLQAHARRADQAEAERDHLVAQLDILEQHSALAEHRLCELGVQLGRQAARIAALEAALASIKCHVCGGKGTVYRHAIDGQRPCPGCAGTGQNLIARQALGTPASARPTRLAALEAALRELEDAIEAAGHSAWHAFRLDGAEVGGARDLPKVRRILVARDAVRQALSGGEW